MELSLLRLTKINGKAPIMEVMRQLITNGVKALSNPSDMETIMDNIMNKALTSSALSTFKEIAFMFMTIKL